MTQKRLIDLERLEQLCRDNVPFAEIAKEFGVKESSARATAFRLGLMRRKQINVAALREMAAKGMNTLEMAEALGFRRDSVVDALARHKIPYAKQTTRVGSRAPMQIDPDEFRKHYREGITNAELARIFGCGEHIIRAMRHRLGLPSAPIGRQRKRKPEPVIEKKPPPKVRIMGRPSLEQIEALRGGRRP